jgi:hypothetical protein
VNATEQIDAAVCQSLESLADELFRGDWNGRREREVVSLFCFGHLLSHFRPGTALHDPAQLSIEVAVPQIPGQVGLTGKTGSKAQVCKDIVIWPLPRMVVWDPSGKPTLRPISVIEWKHNEDDVSPYDLKWLCDFSSLSREFVGYAVCTNHPARGFTLSCTRVALGRRTNQWLHVN